jgi:Flp pilus assembly protein TadG
MKRISSAGSGRGQALVEFSLVLIPFLYLLLGVADLGRGIYVYNGVAQAAREIARATSAHPCNTSSPCVLGTSTETASVTSTQSQLVPIGTGGAVTIVCTDDSDNIVSSTNCDSYSGHPRFVRVTVQTPFQVITPLLSMVAPSTLSSTTHIKMP